jgi:Dyp-type peroxidase family
MAVDLFNIQGNVMPGFNKDHQAFMPVKFKNGHDARAWLRELLVDIASAEEVRVFNTLFKLIRDRRRDEETSVIGVTWVNVAVSWHGLQHLLEGETGGVPRVFSANEAPGTQSSASRDVDALLIVASDRANDLATEVKRQEEILARHAGKKAGKIFEGHTLPNLRGHEHFGFKDGVSQPRIQEVGDDLTKPGGVVSANEFVLGERGTEWPQGVPMWARQGSFLVFLELQQRVWDFRDALGRQAQDKGLDESALGAALVGRDVDGNEITPVSPVSHIGRVRPWSLPHETAKRRLIRRGIPYGQPLPPGADDDGKDRGLLFLCYQASITEQFEHVWRHWLNEDFPERGDGLDGLIGQRGTEAPGAAVAQLPKAEGGRIELKLPQFVIPKYGGYFFAPTIDGLAQLSGANIDRRTAHNGENNMTTQDDANNAAQQLRRIAAALENGVASQQSQPRYGTIADLGSTPSGGSCLDVLAPAGSSFGDFVCSEFPYGAYSNIRATQPVQIVGVASANNAGNGFAGTVKDVERSDQYMQWKVGSEAFDITKAMVFRYTYTNANGDVMEEKVLVGFSGPPWIVDRR